MKSVEFKQDYYSGKTTEEAMSLKFGKFLHEADSSEPYEQSASVLYKKEKKYYLIESEGCSCWDGDWDGWELTKTELLKLMSIRAKKEYYRLSHEKIMAIWVLKNIKPIKNKSKQ